MTLTTIVVIRADGSAIFLPELAKLLGITCNAIYKRYKNGWTDEELLQNYRNTPASKPKDGVGNQFDWKVLLLDPQNRPVLEQRYQRYRKYIKGHRFESRSEFLYRYCIESKQVPFTMVCEHLDGNGGVLPEGKSFADVLDEYDRLFNYAKHNWYKAFGKPFTHPRYDPHHLNLFVWT